MKGYYKKTTKLDFGTYKGYDLGIVYIFDPSYIDWCINNIDNFYITDLDELMELAVVNSNLDWQYKMIGDPSLIPNIDAFDFQDLMDENISLGNKKYKFSEETLNKNAQKSSSSNHAVSSEGYEEEYDDYDDGYGGYEEEYDDYGYGRYEDYDDYDDDFCPACGGQEYMCCNYWIEQNT
jgi:hypothetical protein